MNVVANGRLHRTAIKSYFECYLFNFYDKNSVNTQRIETVSSQCNELVET